MKDKQYLYTMYNATSTDDGTGEIERYENWLERQLLSRIEKLEALEKANGQESEQRQLTIPGVSCQLPTPEEMATVRLETEIKSNIALWADEDQVKYWKEVYSYGVEDERRRVGNCS